MDKLEFQKAVGRRIREVRQEKKISQAELAALCNFEKSNMNRIEAGNTCASSYTLYKIATSLNVKIADITSI